MPSFGPVLEVASLFHGFTRPWYIAGGWAIDLFLERETREHEDIDVAILRRDQTDLRSALAAWTFEKVVEGRRLPWADGERLEPPVHEVHADRATGSPSRLEILLSESSGATWRFRRNPAVTRPLSRIGMRTTDGVPFLAPEIALLFKAKTPAEKDVRDFELVRPRLAAEPRGWLRRALGTCYPGHPWQLLL